MIRYLSTLFILTSWLLLSCKNDNVDKESNNCQLEKFINGNTTRTIQYNTNNLPYLVTLYDDSSKQLLSVDTLKYDTQKRLVLIRNTRHSSVVRDFAFQYNGSKEYPSTYAQTSYITSTPITYSYSLLFNDTGQLAQISPAGNFISISSMLTYDSAGDLDKVVNRFSDSPYEYIDFQKTTADNKLTPWSSSFSLKLYSYIRLGFIDSFSAHNITTSTVSSNITEADNAPPVVETTSKTSLLQYNENGYPISQVEKTTASTLNFSFSYLCP